MPTNPNHPPDEGLPRASRQFTDREEFVEAFERAVSGVPLRDNKVLVYYGVGGIGKTSLREELGRLLDEQQRPKIAWAVLDFVTPTHRNVEDALFWLRQELNSKYGVRFLSFELACVQFWHKSRPHSPLRREDWPMLKEGDLIGELISIAGNIPMMEFVVKMPILVQKTHGFVRDWWTKRGNQELYHLQNMAPNDIAERLPMFFANDLKDFMRRESRPVVLFIDTYEALWEGQRTEARFFSQDEWVRQLVTQLPEVLWVIAGRDKVRWEEDAREKVRREEDKPGWGSYLEQHLVGELTDEDARRFLVSCEITEEAVQRAIVKGSKGVPFYLDVSVDVYLEIKKQGKIPSPLDFGRTPKKVVDRFLRHLEESEEETLKVLSVARFWDRRLFKLLIKEFETGYPATAMSKLCRFSFIQEEQIPGMWTIHPLMREGLEEHQDAELRGEVHQYLFDHYNQQLQGLESTAISDPHKTALTEAFHHGRHALAPEEFFDWFTTIEKAFELAALWPLLFPLHEELARVMEDSLGVEHPATGASVNNLATLHHKLGRYEEAEPLYERALKIWEKIPDPEYPYVATALNNLAVLYANLGRTEEAEPLYKQALEIREEVLGRDHPDTATSLGNLAGTYSELERYEDAEPLYERALEIREKVLEPEHPDIATSLNGLAVLYCQLGRYEEAEPPHKRALGIRKKVLSKEHPDIAESVGNLAGVYYELERYEEAESLYKEALEIREVLDPEHPKNAFSLNNLGTLYYKLRRYEEAEPLLKRALEIREKVPGPKHPYTATSLDKLATLYYDLERYEEAERLYQRSLQIREEKLGPDHPDATRTREALEDVQKKRREGSGEPDM